MKLHITGTDAASTASKAALALDPRALARALKRSSIPDKPRGKGGGSRRPFVFTVDPWSRSVRSFPANLGAAPPRAIGGAGAAAAMPDMPGVAK
jgi:hypothetical protein